MPRRRHHNILAVLAGVLVITPALLCGLDAPGQAEGTQTAAAIIQAAAEAFEAGDFAAASEAYKRFVEQFPDSPLRAEAAYWRGESLYRQHKYTEATRAYQQALELGLSDQTAPFALYSIARAHVEAEQSDLAAEVLQQFLDTYPHNALAAECTYLLAGLLSDQGEHQRATALYQRVLTDFPEAEFARPARFGLAASYQQAGRLEDARKLFTEIAGQGGEDSTTARLRSAECAYLLGDYRTACVEYASIPAQTPEHVRARYGLALCYDALGESKRARDIYLELVASDVEAGLPTRAALRLADQYYREGNYDAARQWYTEARSQSHQQLLSDEAELGLLVVSSAQEPSVAKAKAVEEIASRHIGDALGPRALYEVGLIYSRLGEYRRPGRRTADGARISRSLGHKRSSSRDTAGCGHRAVRGRQPGSGWQYV